MPWEASGIPPDPRRKTCADTRVRIHAEGEGEEIRGQRGSGLKKLDGEDAVAHGQGAGGEEAVREKFIREKRNKFSTA